jgi:MoxR-like ATPase
LATQDAIGTIALDNRDDVALADRMKNGREQIRTELKKLIIGQDEVIEQVLLTLFVGGNSLIVGVPGLAKTLLIHTIAQVLDLKFSRIQFTPDLMPSDITGTDIIQEDVGTGRRAMTFAPGPIFANIVLADEINRTPPKTQSALLEAMQEHRVTVQGRTYVLDEPFYVFATQNPIELEGTYPLPEAQLDRFMFQIIIDHLKEDEELEVIRTTTGILAPVFSHAVTGPDLIAFQKLVRRVPVSESVLRYAVALTRMSRPSKNGGSPDFVKKWIAYGASPRAAQYLVLGAKARALTKGRYHVSFEDIAALAHPVLRHRVLTNFHAESEGKTKGEMVDMLLDAVRVPASGM